ncbi:MAG: hypothetical protein AABZ39_19275 [Spirochaetota bacterium]
MRALFIALAATSLAIAQTTNILVGGKSVSCTKFERNTNSGFDGTLSSDCVIPVGAYSIPFTGGSTLSLYATQRAASGVLLRDTTLSIGAYDVTFRAGSRLSFHENGMVREGHPSGMNDVALAVGALRMQFKPADDKKHYTLSFYPNARFERGYLERDTTVTVGKNAFVLKADTPVTFYESGTLKAGYCAKDFTVTIAGAAVAFSANTEIGFYTNGGVRYGFLAKDTTLGTGGKRTTFIRNDAKTNFSVSFYENGAIESGFPAQDTTFTLAGSTFTLAAKNRVTYHRDGTPLSGIIAKRFVYEKILNDKTRITMILEPKDMLHVYHPSGAIIRFYGASPLGMLKENLPFTAYGKEIILPRACIVVPVNDPSVVWNITALENVPYNGRIFLRSNETVSFRDLEQLFR